MCAVSFYDYKHTCWLFLLNLQVPVAGFFLFLWSYVIKNGFLNLTHWLSLFMPELTNLELSFAVAMFRYLTLGLSLIILSELKGLASSFAVSLFLFSTLPFSLIMSEPSLRLQKFARNMHMFKY